ncbi:hypothetical protein ACIOHS_02040 [Streptomyces sp. NPDC088253]|uniref:hypothetical protein n=1 Tax=Streptomyces sp. NPDC088253 TaxID=3365846 RepID=UPI00382EE346
MFAHSEAEDVTWCIYGTELLVRRRKAGRFGRAAFVCGKRRQNTIKTTTISDGQGRTLWCGAAVGPDARADRGAREFPDQVSAPPREPKNLGEGALTDQYGRRQAKRRQSSQRIPVEHADAELRQRRPLQRWTGRRQDYAEAIAGEFVRGWGDGGWGRWEWWRGRLHRR